MRHGIGIFDSGHFPKALVDGAKHPLSRKWESMFVRCYSQNKQAARPGYIGCTVAPGFHRYQDFCAWASMQIGFDQDGWQLDKDILVRDNKVYSPETCCFVPLAINNLFRANFDPGALPIGVTANRGQFSAIVSNKNGREWLGRFDTPELAFAAYKARKEELIKEAAEEYGERIASAVYAAMMAYEVQITG